MLDIKYIKECPDEVIARLAIKGISNALTN